MATWNNQNKSYKTCLISLAVLALVCALVLLPCAPSLAHKINIYAYIEDGQVKGEGYFAGGNTAKQAKVMLLDHKGRELAATHSDDQGFFSLPLPATAQGKMRVVLKGGYGHQGECTLIVAAQTAQEGRTQAFGAATAHQGTAAERKGRIAVELGELEARLVSLLDQRLQPLTQQIAKLSSERGVTVTEVLGGLGYIMGLLGLAAYLKVRRDN